jgi:hypothetical protein
MITISPFMARHLLDVNINPLFARTLPPNNEPYQSDSAHPGCVHNSGNSRHLAGSLVIISAFGESQGLLTCSTFPSESRIVTAFGTPFDVHETSQTPSLKLTWYWDCCGPGGNAVVAKDKTSASAMRRPGNGLYAGSSFLQPLLPITAKHAMNINNLIL